MLHNGLLNLMIHSTCIGHHYARNQELATIQMAPACGTSPWLWQVAGLVHGCRFKHPGRGMLHELCNIHLPGRLNPSVFATIQMAPACDTPPWLWQVTGLVHGCRFTGCATSLYPDA
jgi:hypothetical protein